MIPAISFAEKTPEPSGRLGLQILENIQSAMVELAERTKPSVVSIGPVPDTSRSEGFPRRSPGSNPGNASGVIIDTQGHIVTNNHVIEHAKQVEVRLADGTKLIAKVVGIDPDTDLAVIKVPTEHSLSPAKFANSKDVKVGQWALAIGNPFGLNQTVTVGVISGVGRDNINLSKYENFIQTDAPINPGNSGGPLFNLRGEIIGINSAIINFAQGIGFAIPSNMVKRVVDELVATGQVSRGWLGVGIQRVSAQLGKKFGVKEGQGVLVNEVFADDPAGQSGIQPGDIITKVNGKFVDTPGRLSRLIAGLRPGDTAHLEIIRDHQTQALAVLLTQRKEDQIITAQPLTSQEERLGLHVQSLTEALAKKYKLNDQSGVLIMQVDHGSLAKTEDLRVGDLIKEVNRQDVNTVKEFEAALEKTKRGETILLRIMREARAFYVVLRNPQK